MKNKTWVIFKNTLILLFILFLINYFIANTGYYNKINNKKTIMTEEKIKEFESDIKNNEYIDIKKYTNEEEQDTSNIMSNLGYKTSETINDIVTNKLFKLFKIVGKLFK